MGLSDERWDAVDGIYVPRVSLPPYVTVSKVEFVRSRVFRHDEVLDDYRVHFRDGTHDCLSFAHGSSGPAIGKFFRRSPSAFLPNTYVSWDEDAATCETLIVPTVVAAPTVVVGGFEEELGADHSKPKKRGKSEVIRRREAEARRRFEVENAKPF